MSKRLRNKQPVSGPPLAGDWGGTPEHIGNNPSTNPLPTEPVLTTIMRHIHEPIVLVDRGSRILAINDAACDALGVPPGSQGLAMDPSLYAARITDSEGAPLTRETSVYVRALGGEQVVNQVEVHHGKDGTARHYMTSGYPIRGDDGEVDMALIVSREVSEFQRLQARTERMLEVTTRREQAERAVIESIPAGVMIIDSDLRLLLWNGAFRKYSRSDIPWRVGMPLLRAMPRAEESGVMRLVEEALASGEPVAAHELRCAAVTGQVSYWSGSVVPISLPWKDRVVRGLALVALDVTHQVQARERLAELATVAEQRAVELEAGRARDRAIADKLQTSFLPAGCPTLPGYEFGQHYAAGLDEALVGGDFYDMFAVGQDRLGLVMADVAGKGLRAAVYTAMTKYMLRAYALENCSPEKVLARLNEALSACTPFEVFVTLVYGVLDAATGTLTYANAGHEPPIHYSQASGITMTLDVTGKALALATHSTYATRTIRLGEGDVILLYTDGITDAGAGTDRLGVDRLLRLVETSPELSALELADRVLATAMSFADKPLVDDAALLVIKAIHGEGR